MAVCGDVFNFVCPAETQTWYVTAALWTGGPNKTRRKAEKRHKIVEMSNETNLGKFRKLRNSRAETLVLLSGVFEFSTHENSNVQKVTIFFWRGGPKKSREKAAVTFGLRGYIKLEWGWIRTRGQLLRPNYAKVRHKGVPFSWWWSRRRLIASSSGRVVVDMV